MWLYDKKLEYPIKIKKPDPKMAKNIITQYGGPDGELAASLRYLSQRFSMITPEAKATLNDIGSEVSILTQKKSNPTSERVVRAGIVLSRLCFVFPARWTSASVLSQITMKMLYNQIKVYLELVY